MLRERKSLCFPPNDDSDMEPVRITILHRMQGNRVVMTMQYR